MEEIDIKKDAFQKRWISYFDLLGFSDLVQTKGELDVFITITTALEEFGRKRNPNDHFVERVWFSDSFILYSQGASDIDFSYLEQASRHFFLSLIQKEIPVRGALACGEVYADKDNNIIKGLLEAYKYAENQDWIGLILTPTAVQRMEEIRLPAKERPYYALWSIPFKKCKKGFRFPPELPACRIDTPGIQVILGSMRQKLDSKNQREVIQKYDRTIEFSEKTAISSKP